MQISPMSMTLVDVISRQRSDLSLVSLIMDFIVGTHVKIRHVNISLIIEQSDWQSCV